MYACIYVCMYVRNIYVTVPGKRGHFEHFVKIELLTLSAHAREGYSSHFVCLSVCLCVTFQFWRRSHFQG